MSRSALHLTHTSKNVMTSGKPLNVVLFGETGSGKSAVINLLAGKVTAPTSSDSGGCTEICQSYTLVLNDVSYTIWDTPGLEQPIIGETGYRFAIEQLCKLIRELSKTSGLDLLLFCHRRGRITTTTQRNYTLVYEVVCRKAVPAGIIITHLEQEKRMEDWWDQNAKIFEQRGIEVSGHACVTTLRTDSKMTESREALEHLLGSYDNNGGYKRFTRTQTMESEVGDLMKTLQERCGLRECHACRITEILVEW